MAKKKGSHPMRRRSQKRAPKPIITKKKSKKNQPRKKKEVTVRHPPPRSGETADFEEAVPVRPEDVRAGPSQERGEDVKGVEKESRPFQHKEPMKNPQMPNAQRQNVPIYGMQIPIQRIPNVHVSGPSGHSGFAHSRYVPSPGAQRVQHNRNQMPQSGRRPGPMMMDEQDPPPETRRPRQNIPRSSDPSSDPRFFTLRNFPSFAQFRRPASVIDILLDVEDPVGLERDAARLGPNALNLNFRYGPYMVSRTIYYIPPPPPHLPGPSRGRSLPIPGRIPANYQIHELNSEDSVSSSFPESSDNEYSDE